MVSEDRALWKKDCSSATRSVDAVSVELVSEVEALLPEERVLVELVLVVLVPVV